MEHLRRSWRFQAIRLWKSYENVDDLKKLPALIGGFSDKAILLSCEKRKLPMSTETTSDWQAFEEELARQRPAFALHRP